MARWRWPRRACRAFPTIAWCAPATAAWWYRPMPHGRPRISCATASSTTAATPLPRRWVGAAGLLWWVRTVLPWWVRTLVRTPPGFRPPCG
ncbi:hypothetical protein G6F40_016054 [Rhizopus arrhizus]|nr:hypothetical protein G6F40_016054 [Rhizopus arrhizus]